MSKSPSSPTTDNWSIEEAKRTYHIDRWGLSYFDIDEEGRVVAQDLINKMEKPPEKP